MTKKKCKENQEKGDKKEKNDKKEVKQVTAQCRLPKFRLITGSKYNYPKTEEEWKRVGALALEYCRARKECSFDGKKVPRNYMYETMLQNQEDRRKAAVRQKHLRELHQNGVDTTGKEVHHFGGEYNQFKKSNLVVMSKKMHQDIHLTEKYDNASLKKVKEIADKKK